MASPGGTRGPSSAPELPERLQRLLSALVREYIEHGEPVSSQWLAGHSGCAVSSATVRNVLARLEELGFVRQPHTSAGRVPTDLAYRYYVDALLNGRRVAGSRATADVEARLRRGTTPAELLASVSHELFRVSHHLGFALTPASESTLQRIDFLPLDGGARLLVVIVSSGGEIVNKVIAWPDPVSREELLAAANYLSEEFSGLTLSEARAAVLERMRQDRLLYDELFGRALRLAGLTLDELPAETGMYVAGMPALLEVEVSDGETFSTLRTILSMIEEKHRLVRLLTACIDQPGVTVIIGHEHAAPDLRNFSLVAATYTDGQRTGTLGILGPTRMKYSRAIAAVDSVSQAVTRMLADGSN